MENINDLNIGQRVQLDGEQGTIKEIDYDNDVVWVTVAVQNGMTDVDVSPDEPWFEVIK
jgi:hypothetical protein